MTLDEIREGIRIATGAIKSHKLRSFLTVLGGVIGITSVVGMVSLIGGLNASMSRQIQSLGSNIIYVSRFRPEMHIGRRSAEERQRPPITIEEAMAIKKFSRRIAYVSPENYFFSPKVKYRDREANFPPLVGILPDYAEVRNTNLKTGRFITDGDVIHGTDIVVIGSEPADALFPDMDPIGKTITVDGYKLTVVGVLEERGQMMGFNPDNLVFVPYKTYQRLHPEEKELSLAIRPAHPDSMPQAIDEVTSILRRHRGVAYDEPDNFHLSTQDTLNELYEQLTQGIYLAMIIISSIGLLVGGIGVMNILIVSVTERTREIGIRKAIGARRRDILIQFLVEAMTLTGAGGIFGIVFGIGISALVKALSPIPATVSVPWIIIAFSVSLSVGLTFGIFPALKAARLHPIDALRYE
jgi:putative ABC transport system permease protein